MNKYKINTSNKISIYLPRSANYFNSMRILVTCKGNVSVEMEWGVQCQSNISIDIQWACYCNTYLSVQTEWTHANAIQNVSLMCKGQMLTTQYNTYHSYTMEKCICNSVHLLRIQFIRVAWQWKCNQKRFRSYAMKIQNSTHTYRLLCIQTKCECNALEIFLYSSQYRRDGQDV